MYHITLDILIPIGLSSNLERFKKFFNHLQENN